MPGYIQLKSLRNYVDDGIQRGIAALELFGNDSKIKVHIESSDEERDVRVVTDEHIVKIALTHRMEIRMITVDDIAVYIEGAGTPPEQASSAAPTRTLEKSEAEAPEESARASDCDNSE